MTKSKKVFIVVDATDGISLIIGVYSTKSKAEKIAYADKTKWCNIIEKELDN